MANPTVTEADRGAAQVYYEFLRPSYRLSDYEIGQLAIEFAAHRERATASGEMNAKST